MKSLMILLATISVSAGAVTKEVKDAGKAVAEQHDSLGYPERAVVAPVGVPVGNAMMWGADNADNVVEMAKGIYGDLKEGGRCAGKAEHPGQLMGCAIITPTNMVVTFVDGVGFLGTSTVNYAVGETLGTLNAEIARAAGTAAQSWQETWTEMGAPRFGEFTKVPFLVVELVFDATGKVISATNVSLIFAINTTVNGFAMTVTNLVDVPVSILDGRFSNAGEAFGMTIHSAACTVIDLFIGTPVNFISKLIGKEAPRSCLDQAKEIFVQIKAGTYKYEVPEDSPYLN